MIELTQEERLRRQWGAEVRRLREELDLSQGKLAAAVGVDQNTISRIERGIYAGSDATRISLARALHVQVHELFAYPSTTEAAS